jgi:NAD(P)-dependent dehydrogenase (short-subunit alcohol dehydrogenase family)
VTLWVGFEPGPPKVAIVTGASSGIGRAIAVKLGSLGWSVGVGARRTDRLAQTATAVEAAGGRAAAVPLDLRDPDSVAAFFGAVESQLGPLDVLVNNAGMTHIGPVSGDSPSDIRNVFETNVIGPYYATSWATRSLLDRDAPGEIIFVSSSAVHVPWPHQVLYGVTKTGLDALARGLALEVEGTGIRVTIVRVGPVRTEVGANLDPTKMTDLLDAWKRAGVLRTFQYLPVEQAAYMVALVATAPPEMLLREVFADTLPPAEPLSFEEIEAGTGRRPS